MRFSRVFSMSLRHLAGLLCGLLVSASACADPGYYLVVPYATPGQLALDLRYWTVKPPDSQAVLWPEAGLRYGVNSRWTTGLLASFIGESLRQQRLSSWNWQNDWLLTQGQYDFDLALHTQLIHEAGEGNMLEFGPVYQTELGHVRLNANLIFERALSHADGTQAKYQWQALTRLRPGLRVGVQGFGELGRIGRSEDARSHRAGPVVHLGPWDKIELQAAYLWGEVYGHKAEMFSAQVVYTF